MNIKIHASSSQIVQKKNKRVIGIGNSNDKKLYVNKSGAMMLINKKTDNIEKKENSVTNTLSNKNIFINNYINTKKNNGNICSSFRQNNELGTNKLQNTISFGNSNIISKPNMSILYNTKKSGSKKEDNYFLYNKNNILTSTNISLL